MSSTTQRPLALVTGASSGIGLELAKLFAEHGYDLARIASAARDEPKAAGYLRALLADPDRPAAGWREALSGTRAGEEVERFLARYGHRAVREWELAEPRWREDPGYILRTAAAFLDTSPPARPKPGPRLRVALIGAPNLTSFT